MRIRLHRFHPFRPLKGKSRQNSLIQAWTTTHVLVFGFGFPFRGRHSCSEEIKFRLYSQSPNPFRPRNGETRAERQTQKGLAVLPFREPEGLGRCILNLPNSYEGTEGVRLLGLKQLGFEPVYSNNSNLCASGVFTSI